MPLSDLAVATAAARAGGAVVRDGFSQPQAIEYKGTIDLVTGTDRRAEAAVVALLARERPDDGVLSEEGAEREGARRWVIDPLDGTTNFAHGVPHCCVSVALCDGDMPLAGAIADPLRDELFTAERCGGARWGPLWEPGAATRPLRVSQTDDLIRALVSAGFPYERESAAYARNLRAWERLSRRAQALRRTGSSALDQAWVAAGRLDGYFVAGAKPWDMAAGMLLVREAGGRVTDFAGREATLTSGAWIVSNGPLHEALLTAMR